jgi:hypothetical protein
VPLVLLKKKCRDCLENDRSHSTKNLEGWERGILTWNGKTYVIKYCCTRQSEFWLPGNEDDSLNSEILFGYIQVIRLLHFDYYQHPISAVLFHS